MPAFAFDDFCLGTFDVSGYTVLVNEPGFVEFFVNIPMDYNRVRIDIITSGNWFNTYDEDLYFNSDGNFSVWVDDRTTPVYVTCSGVNDSYNIENVVDSFVISADDNYDDIKAHQTYTVYDTSDNTTYYIGFSLIIISILSLLTLVLIKNKQGA